MFYFLPKRDDIIKDWIQLHNEELSNFYTSNIIRRSTPEDDTAAYVVRIGSEIL
jgi:hypothetical protein